MFLSLGTWILALPIETTIAITMSPMKIQTVNLCYIHKMRILNGDCDGDREGEFTFVSDSGSSVNDYFLVSLDFPRVQNSAGPCFSACWIAAHAGVAHPKHGTPTRSTCNCWPSHCSHKTRLARQPDTNIPKQCHVKCVYKYSGRDDWTDCTWFEEGAWRICVSFAERCCANEENVFQSKGKKARGSMVW